MHACHVPTEPGVVVTPCAEPGDVAGLGTRRAHNPGFGGRPGAVRRLPQGTESPDFVVENLFPEGRCRLSGNGFSPVLEHRTRIGRRFREKFDAGKVTDRTPRCGSDQEAAGQGGFLKM